MALKRPSVAIVGATGVVGRELVRVLEERRFPCEELRLLASPRSAGSTLAVRGATLPVRALTPGSFEGVDLAFFAAGGAVSRTHVPEALAAGANVIDNSSVFRLDDAVPLVVPEVNGHLLDKPADGARIIANPNCCTIIALLAVTPLRTVAGIERMVVSTYQAASGGGAALMRELETQMRECVAGQPYTTTRSGRQYVLNVYSHESAVAPNGYNEEELKLVRETHKIWADSSVRITATCIRVPVRRAHCVSINLTFREPLSEPEARTVLENAPGVVVIDDRSANVFPEPVGATGCAEVHVGRIRGDISQPPGFGLDLFVAGDQVLKGAALNAVQIAERVYAGVSDDAIATRR